MDLEDIRSGSADFEELLRSAIDNALAGRLTHLPVKVVEDSKDGNTAKVKCALKLPKMNGDGSVEWVELPEFDDCIVRFQGAGGFSSTHPIKKDDEGWITFGSRGISNWHEKGDVQPSVEARGPLSDAMFHPGSRSKPNRLQGVSKDSAQTRTDDKKSLSDVSNTAVTHIRENSAHQTNGQGVLSQHQGSTHFVDASTIQNVAGKILLNC